MYLIFAGCRLQFYCSGNWGVPAIWILRDVVRGSNLLLCICGLWRHSNLWYILSFVLIFDKVYNNFFKCQLTGNMVKIISSNEIVLFFFVVFVIITSQQHCWGYSNTAIDVLVLSVWYHHMQITYYLVNVVRHINMLENRAVVTQQYGKKLLKSLLQHISLKGRYNRD